MVKKALLAALSPALLLLGACGFFTSSLFPGYLAQVEASVDLGARIDNFIGSNPDVSWYSDLFVLRTWGGASYAGLLVRKNYLPEKTLILLDTNMGLKQITDPALDSLHITPVFNPPFEFQVGQVAFDLSSPPITINRGNVGGLLGFSDGVQNYLLYIDGAFPTTLQYNVYNATWGYINTPNPQLAYSGGYELRNLFYDPSPPTTGEEVILVLYSRDSNEVVIAFTPQSEYGLQFSGKQPILDYAGFRKTRFQNIDVNSFLYTRKGIVATNYNGQGNLYDLTGAETGKRLDLGNHKQVRLAFNLEGEMFFAFNEDDRILYKGKTGW